MLFDVDASERGAVYKFELSARNDVNYGDAAVQTIRTPDGSKQSYLWLEQPTAGLSTIHCIEFERSKKFSRN